jgi:uncharacterized protein (TIGR03382 family)
MRNLALAAVAGLALTGAAKADFYFDSVGDTFTGAGGGILDIVAVEVTNDLTNINFAITVLGDVDSTDWGKYMIGIRNPGVANLSSSNGWGRPIELTGGMNAWMGSWVDSGNGLQAFSYSSGSWSGTGATGPFAGPGGTPVTTPGLLTTKSGNLVTISAPLAVLDIALGSTIVFDIYTSGGGGGDSAIDSLTNPGTAASDWGTPYAGGGSEYFVVPTPGAAALGLAAAALVGRRRR